MKTLIVLIGPTGVGKTELSLRLAEHFGTCIISADSRQLYADLKIGTAAPTPEQLQRVRHYFVGTLQLTDYYSAAQYEAEVLQLLEQLYTRHEVVLLTGGSMMYVDAVCKGIDDIPTVDAETRRLMLHKYETEGLEHLCAELKLLDPEYYKIVDLKNHKRVIHALEICYMTGKTYTSFRTQQKKERPFRIIKIGLTRDREELYARINQRVEQIRFSSLFSEFSGSALQCVPPQKIPDRSDPHILILSQDHADLLMFPGQPMPFHPVLQYEMYIITIFSLAKALPAAISPALHYNP